MDKFKTIGLGGLPLVLDDLRWFFGRLGSPNEGMYQAFNNLLRGFGEDFIIQGVVATGTSPNIAITEGWVLLAGELLKVDAQTGISTNKTFVKVTTFDSRGNKTFQNASVEDTYEKNRAVATGTGGNLAFNGVTLLQLVNGADTLPNVGRVGLDEKIIEIGDWNMDSTASVNITHGLGGTVFKNIRSVKVMIRDNADSLILPLNSYDTTADNGTVNGAVANITNTLIILSRTPSAKFDAISFNSTSFNRGFITIEFEL
ncbi:MAG: hypothetical protein IID03_12365 [Candidatus Dadabacteria bacterium]|nr:hypothetical protein [Candidatus Dadabacteria bacterium]